MPAEKRRPCLGACGLNRAERFFKSPRARVCFDCQRRTRKKTSRARRVVVTYGLTQEQHDALLAAQGGVCAVCGGKRLYALNVDHDHTTGFVRGLLCRRCNGQLLTAARNDPELLERAAAYLRNPPAYEVIGQQGVPSNGAQ